MATRAAYRIPTRYTGLADLKNWFARAADGATLDYAWGPGLDQNEPTVRMVVELKTTMQVLPLQRRENGGLVYFVKRTKRPTMPTQVSRVRVDPAFRATPEGQLLLVLETLADRHQPCPKNADLAEKAGLRDKEAARYALGKLESSGRIQLVANGHDRVVTIVATGKQTAASR